MALPSSTSTRTTSPSTLSSPSPSPASILATRIFINQVPDYDLLSSCAEAEVSSIVRDMSYGCGDGSRTTSYACFCYSSSGKFDSMIGAHVRTACQSDSDGAQQSTAKDVFSQYCEIGVRNGVGSVTGAVSIATTLSVVQSRLSSILSSSVSASASAVPSTPTPSSTSTSLSAQTSSSSSPSRTIIIALAVSLPILLALILAALFFFRYRKRAAAIAAVASQQDNDTSTSQSKHHDPASEIHTEPSEMAAKDKPSYFMVELPTEKAKARTESVAELPEETVERRVTSNERSVL